MGELLRSCRRSVTLHQPAVNCCGKRGELMLDIGIIIPELTKYGGAERLLIECVVRWQHDHAITIYAAGFDESILMEHGITARVKLVEISPHFEGPHSIVLNAVLLPKIWEQEIGKHDVYHGHLWPTHLIDLHPMVWYPHEPLRILYDMRYEQTIPAHIMPVRNVHIYPKYHYDGLLEPYRQAYLNTIDLFDKVGKPDRIVANSKYTAAYLEDIYGRKVPDVVYPGVNPDDFIVTTAALPQSLRLTFESASHENVFLTVGQLWRHKRIGLAIEAMKMVENAQLYIVGQGPERENLRRMAKLLGLQNRVFFLGGLTNLELRILYSRALGVVFTPMKEPFGIVALEAMAAGKALIGVDEGGFNEVVDESCAFLVKPEPTLIAEKMAFLRDNKDKAREMGLAGRAKAKDYTWDHTAQGLLQRIRETHSEWNASNRATCLSHEESEAVLFGIQYYCWYGNGIGSSHWNDNQIYGGVTDIPTMGYYASNSGTTIRSHLSQLEDAGLDFVVLNLHIDREGFHSRELVTIENMFSLARSTSSSLRFAVQLCLQHGIPDDLPDLIALIRRRFCRNPYYLHLDGRPVLYLFWTGVLDGLRSAIRVLRDSSEGMVRIASSLRFYDRQTEHRKTMGLFDGFSLFSPLDLSNRSRWRETWAKAYSESEAGNMGWRIVTCGPGYDDSHLEDPERSGSPYRIVPRDGGKTYETTIDFALSLKPRPHQVLISSWNEYHENTHIEPSMKYGSKYLDMTKDFIYRGRKLWQKARAY